VNRTGRLSSSLTLPLPYQVNQRKPLPESKREKDITGGIEATVTIKNGFYYGKILEIVLIGAVITENSFKRT